MSEEKIIRQFEENKDGIVYIVTMYESGRIKKKRKPGYEKAITNTQAAQLEMEMTMQYVSDILEDFVVGV